jgi:hypothetical protein
MEQIKELINDSNFKQNELISIVQFCNEKIRTRLEICDECGFIGIDLIEGCDGYKNYTEKLCNKCATYCSNCQIYYGKSAKYKHENCDKPDSENEDAEVCEYCNEKFLNYKNHFEKCVEQSIEIDKIYMRNNAIYYFQGAYAYHTIDCYSIASIQKANIDDNHGFEITYDVKEFNRPDYKERGLTLNHLFQIKKIFNNSNMKPFYTKIENGFIKECVFMDNEKDKYKLLGFVTIRNQPYGAAFKFLNEKEEYEYVDFLYNDNIESELDADMMKRINISFKNIF